MHRSLVSQLMLRIKADVAWLFMSILRERLTRMMIFSVKLVISQRPHGPLEGLFKIMT